MKSIKSAVVTLLGLTSLLISFSALSSEAVETIKQFYSAVDGEAYNSATLDRLLAKDFKDHNREHVQEGVSDRQASIYFYGQLAKGFPDAVHTAEMLEPVGQDKVLLYWDYTGTNTGEFFGMPASGNKISIKGVEIFKVKNGQITDMWHIEELQKMEKQLKDGS